MKDHRILLGRLIMRIRPAPLAAGIKRLLLIRRFEADTAEGRFDLDPASYLGLRLLETGAYEPEMAAAMKHFLGPGDTLVDVGANEGYFTVVGSRQVGPGGRVVAVEPQARLQATLRRNLELNRCGNVRVLPVAISDRRGEAILHLTAGVNNAASSLMQPTRYGLARQAVPCATLEEVFDQCEVRQCALLKIDIEGWEHEAVLGSPRLFREKRARAIALELHPDLLARRGLDPTAITDFLAECGYARHPDFSSVFVSPAGP